MEYFKYFPVIEYENNQVVNILARVKLRDYLKKNTYIYQPYTLKDFDRPDTLADHYYGNFKYAWLIFYANDIYDPVKDWVLDNDNFYKYLNHKYQETSYATGKQYSVDDKVQFNSLLYGCIESYLADNVISGVRFSDNQFKRLAGYWNTGTILPGQYGFFYSSYLPDQGSYFQITTPTSTELTVSGTLPLGADSVIVMDSSKWQLIGDLRPGYAVAAQTIKEYRNENNLVVDSTYTGTKTPISYFDYEYDANEAKRNIKLIDSRYVPQILQEFKTLLSS